MACPTCSHTLSRLTGTEDMAYYHCERCGTAVVYAADNNSKPLEGFPHVYVPKLIPRCLAFEATLGAKTPARELWRALGIEESINLPEGRPAT